MHLKILWPLSLSTIAILFVGCETLPYPTSGNMAPAVSPHDSANPLPGQNPNSLPPVGNPDFPTPPRRDRIAEHEVVAGDSLWKLARQYETTIKEIQVANNLEGTVIKTGTMIKVPTSVPEALPPIEPLPSDRAAALPPMPTEPGPAPTWSTTQEPTWTTTPPSSSTTGNAPRYRIPDPVIMPPPSDY
ncbi:MAG: LysM peptidoglycan-binding domain-containing protein [Verrucomicrobiota bacterium]